MIKKYTVLLTKENLAWLAFKTRQPLEELNRQMDEIVTRGKSVVYEFEESTRYNVYIEE